MNRRRAAGLALSMGALLLGCGGRQILLLPPDTDDAGTPVTAKATIGPVDLTQAPATIAMSCDHGIGQLAFVNPCLVGNNLGSPSTPVGFHVVECRLATPAQPVAFSFILTLAKVAANPDLPLSFPQDAPKAPPSGPVSVGGSRSAIVSSLTGTLTFSRVDPTNRAFIGHFTGTALWTEVTGAMFSCSIDAPLWGGPGGFT